jgi:hypothetical protein
MGGFCEHGNKPSGFMNIGVFPDHLGSYQLLKKDSLILG